MASTVCLLVCLSLLPSHLDSVLHKIGTRVRVKATSSEGNVIKAEGNVIKVQFDDLAHEEFSLQQLEHAVADNIQDIIKYYHDGQFAIGQRVASKPSQGALRAGKIRKLFEDPKSQVHELLMEVAFDDGSVETVNSKNMHEEGALLLFISKLCPAK
jgi:hypothetical protein